MTTRLLSLLGVCVLAASPLPGQSAMTATGGTAGVTSAAPASPSPAPCVPHAPPAFNPATTITIEVHGWNPADGAFPQDDVYGREGSGSAISDSIRLIGNLPVGLDEPTAPNQVTGVRYYGLIPPAYLEPDEIDEIEALNGIPRYALIVARFTEHVLERSGATGVNFTCHSMGGLVTRYLIENDLLGLVSQGKIHRWVTFAGVVTGANLAVLFDDEVAAAAAFGIDVIDIEHMMPSWVDAHAAACDDNAEEGNNPVWGGLIVHHILANDHTFDEAQGVPGIDLANPDFVANDGILFCPEQQFHAQAPLASFVTLGGDVLEGSRTYHEADHFLIKESIGAHAAAAATLLGSRRVRLVLDSITLLDDNEKDHIFDFSENGFPPAEVAVETQVTWPHLQQAHGLSGLVGERDMNSRAVPVTPIFEGQTISGLEQILYDSPVLDGVDEIVCQLDVREADWYPTEEVLEYPFGDDDDAMGLEILTLPITDQVFQVNLPDAILGLRFEVYELF